MGRRRNAAVHPFSKQPKSTFFSSKLLHVGQVFQLLNVPLLWSRVYVALAKVIIHKSHGEVSLVEHNTIEFVILAYLESISKHSHLYV